MGSHPTSLRPPHSIVPHARQCRIQCQRAAERNLCGITTSSLAAVVTQIEANASFLTISLPQPITSYHCSDAAPTISMPAMLTPPRCDTTTGMIVTTAITWLWPYQNTASSHASSVHSTPTRRTTYVYTRLQCRYGGMCAWHTSGTARCGEINIMAEVHLSISARWTRVGRRS